MAVIADDRFRFLKHIQCDRIDLLPFERLSVQDLARRAGRQSPSCMPLAGWFLIEWPEGQDAPTKYWLSTLPLETSMAELVRQTKLRWRIERDCQELKQEIGLGHYEERNWRGFHHHASLCIAAYGFLVSERGRFPPSKPEITKRQALALPLDYRLRGAPNPAQATRA